MRVPGGILTGSWSGKSASPPSTLSELHYDVAHSARRERNLEALRKFLLPLVVLPYDAAAAQYGDLRQARVVDFEIFPEGREPLGEAPEHSALQPVGPQIPEESLHQVEPRCAGWRERKVETRMALHPSIGPSLCRWRGSAPRTGWSSRGAGRRASGFRTGPA